jgi:hydrogen peroxide-dependent heme synthase
MSVTESAAAALPAVPITIEGSSVLHQLMQLQWTEWRQLDQATRDRIAHEAVSAFTQMEKGGTKASAAFSLLGHKADLMFIHFRDNFDELHELQLRLRKLALFDFLEPASSYLSVVELGLYESTQKTYASLAEQGIQPHSMEWDAEVHITMDRQREAMRVRLFPEIPDTKYVCFYPMDRKRDEDKNWYQVPMEERKRMMHEHGMIGRRYAGHVKQIITGSIGFDDWEWGVDLFADDPLVFKRLIYEMRFDEVSAVYALFGAFYVGKRLPAASLAQWLSVD